MANDRRASSNAKDGNHEGASSSEWCPTNQRKVRFAYIPFTKVTKLMGYEPLTKYIVLFVVLLQISLAVLLRQTPPLSFTFIFCAYVIGGTANQNIFLAIHEITHNLAFKGIVPNKLLAIFANLPIGIPYSAAFKVRSSTSLFCLLIVWYMYDRVTTSNIINSWARMVLIRTFLHGLSYSAWTMY